MVTGASSGLGGVFAEAGADVAVAARRRDRLEEVAGRIATAGRGVLPVSRDAADREQVGALIRAATERSGRIDVMVSNAGTAGEAGPMAERLPHEMFERTVRVNLLGTWYCRRDAGAVMLRQGSGSIINVAPGWFPSEMVGPSIEAPRRRRPHHPARRLPRRDRRHGLGERIIPAAAPVA